MATPRSRIARSFLGGCGLCHRLCEMDLSPAVHRAVVAVHSLPLQLNSATATNMPAMRRAVRVGQDSWPRRQYSQRDLCCCFGRGANRAANSAANSATAIHLRAELLETRCHRQTWRALCLPPILCSSTQFGESRHLALPTVSSVHLVCLAYPPPSPPVQSNVSLPLISITSSTFSMPATESGSCCIQSLYVCLVSLPSVPFCIPFYYPILLSVMLMPSGDNSFHGVQCMNGS